ncbi:MAG: acetylglutamate kinase [Lentisphaeria bacterium]|jgi:acetylglutamate kinase
MQRLIEKAGVLIEALPYIQQFRDSIVVVKAGGSFMEDAQALRGVLRDLVFMECAGMHPVLVHGGGKAINARLKTENVETRFINGLRYTCAKTIQVVDEVLHKVVNAELVAIISEFGGKARAVSGKNVLRAERLQEKDEKGAAIDLGFVGRVVAVDTEQLQWFTRREEIPVVTPLACDLGGQVYNINADMAACVIAAELKAKKLVFLSDVPGILRDPKDPETLISTIHRSEVDALIANGVVSGGMVPKLRSAVEAIAAGCQKVHLIDGRITHSLLLEIFTDQGIGTQITA